MKDKKVVFMGTPDFASLVLENLIKHTNVVLVVTQPDKEVGRKKEIKFSPVKNIAIKNGIKVFQPDRIRNDYQEVLDAEPDIIITCAYGQIIPTVLLDAPEYKAINVHASLLPKLRGGAPIHKAIIYGYEKTGITIMYMSDKMDAGDIISQKEIIISDEDNAGTLHDKLSILGTDLLISTLPEIFSKSNKRIMQNEDEVTFAYNIKREEELIDFNKPAREVYNQVRGLYPWPTAYAVLNGIEIKILSCQIGNQTKGKPGEIINADKNGLSVMCGDKNIIISKVKESGKKEMSASEFINGKKNLLGEVFNEKVI